MKKIKLFSIEHRFVIYPEEKLSICITERGFPPDPKSYFVTTEEYAGGDWKYVRDTAKSFKTLDLANEELQKRMKEMK